jgi:hypothetical protein
MADVQTLLTMATSDEVRRDPFPHLVRSEAVPDSSYRSLQALFPQPDAIIGRRHGVSENAVARMSALQVLDNPVIALEWREFFSAHVSAGFWLDVVRIFGEAMRRNFPDLEARVGRGLEDFRVGIRGDGSDSDVSLECQFAINTPNTQPSSVKTPHIDKRETIFAGLFYLRDLEDQSDGGNLELYTWRRTPRFLPYRMILPNDVALHTQVGYAPNTFVCFVNSEQSVHGVSQRMPSRRVRRYINLIAALPFRAFATRSVSLPALVAHWREARRIQRRQIGRGW